MKTRTDSKKLDAPNMVLIGILLGISFWIIDPLVDVYLLSGDTFLNNAFNPDSQEIWLRSFVSFLFLSFGIFAEFNSSRRKQSEKALRDSEAKFRLLYEDAPLGYQSLNGKGNILKVNRAWLSLLGYDEDEVTGRWFGDFLNEDSRAKFMNRFPIFKTQGEVHGADFVMIKKDGTSLAVSLDGRISRNERGEFKQTHCILRDETERMRAEEQIIKLSQTVEQSPVSVVLTDLKGNIEYVNPKFTELTGYALEEALGQNPRILKSGQTAGEEYKNLWATITGGGQWRGEFRNKKKNGELFWEKASISPIRNRKGEITYYLGVKEDITDKKRIEEALLDREAKYRTLFEYSVDGIFLMTDIFLDCNEQACRMWACEREDIVGHSPVKFSPEFQPDGRRSDESAKDKIDSALSGKPQRFYWKHLRKDGILIDTEVALKAIIVNDRKILQATVRDMTEQKEAEERLELSHSLLAATLESTADGILVVNTKGEIESFNRKFLQLWSIPEDIIALKDDNKALEFVLNQLKYPQQFLDGVKNLYATPEAESFDILEFKDGKYFERFSLPQKIGEDIVGRVWSFRDVTDRKRAQEAFSEEKERLAVTLRSIGDGVITTDTEGFVTLINSVAERLTGWNPNEAIGKKLEQVFKIISSVTKEILPSPVDRALRFGGPIELDSDTVLLTRDGSERMIADSAAPIKDERGDAIGVVLVFRDITEKLRIEEELAKTEKLESLGILAGGIAHDFNNILTAIMGNISLAKMNLPEHTEVSEILTSAEDASARAQDLTHQLLTFARGGAPIKKTASIIPVIKEAAGFALHGSNIRCDFSFDDNLFPVEFDEAQISRVLSNLVINGHQAMPEGGVINISAANINAPLEDHPILREGNWVKITVKDQGIGIPPQYIDRIFDPFFTTKQKGSGLGLAISYSIVKKHGGHIEVESSDGAGSSFHIYLPASRQKIEESKIEDEKPASGVGKILIMDDDEGVREVASITLSRLGYQVTTAGDGREAVGLYKNARESGQPFEAIIMDLTVPGGLGGKEALAILRQYDPNVKAIVSSGYNDDPIMADYGEFGFCGAVCKPYNAGQLGNILHEILGKAKSPVSPS